MILHPDTKPSLEDDDTHGWAVFEAIVNGLDIPASDLKRFARWAADNHDKLETARYDLRVARQALRDMTVTAAFNRAAETVQRLEMEVGK